MLAQQPSIHKHTKSIRPILRARSEFLFPYAKETLTLQRKLFTLHVNTSEGVCTVCAELRPEIRCLSLTVSRLLFGGRGAYVLARIERFDSARGLQGPGLIHYPLFQRTAEDRRLRVNWCLVTHSCLVSLTTNYPQGSVRLSFPFPYLQSSQIETYVIKTQGDTLNESVKTHAGVDCSLYPGSAILLDYIYTVCVLHWNETHWQELICLLPLICNM